MRTSEMKANVHSLPSGAACGDRLQFSVATVAVAALLFAGAAAAGPDRAFAASTSPGKYSAFESSDFSGDGDIPVAVSPLLTATIEKGKRKYVLVVEATLSSGSSPVSSSFILRTTVNGVPMDPTNSGSNEVLQGCGGSFCALTAAWWLDLDAAEAANPGVFIHMPLSVTLEGGELFAAPQSSGRVTMSVRMQKK